MLHAVRTMVYTDTARIAHRHGLSESVVTRCLLEAQSHGGVTWTSFGEQADARFTAVLHHAADDSGWVTGTDRDSAHRVWFELHEDLIATLGLTR